MICLAVVFLFAVSWRCTPHRRPRHLCFPWAHYDPRVVPSPCENVLGTRMGMGKRLALSPSPPHKWPVSKHISALPSPGLWWATMILPETPWGAHLTYDPAPEPEPHWGQMEQSLVRGREEKVGQDPGHRRQSARKQGAEGRRTAQEQRL